MKPKVKKTKTGRLLFLIFFLVLVLSLGKLIVANILATTGGQLGRMESEAVSLKAENQEIEGKLIELSTLSRIASEAEKLGFKKASFVVFLREEVPVALR